LPTLPFLTHLDIEELDNITNESLQALASGPAAQTLKHLSISYCELLGDTGMLPIIKACDKLESVDMDNTRISDLVLMEAAASIRDRNRAAAKANPSGEGNIKVGIRMVVFDCANITWTGVREVLSRNAELAMPCPSYKFPALTESALPNASSESMPSSQSSASATLATRSSQRIIPSYEHSIISLKAFYTWQPTVNEHLKRVQRGDFIAARRLERKWAEWMMVGEEAAHGGRRRRRRMREAMEAVQGEEDPAAGDNGLIVGRRRRARSGPAGGPGGSCVVM
jgi:F-box/leucine-rich repeat protein 2/20